MKTFRMVFYVPVLSVIFLFAGCNQLENAPVEGSVNSGDDNSSLAKQYNLPPAIMAELQIAKISSARYNNIENAIADGYVDINVVIPHMGHHYMNSAYLDGNFEINKPEILVYSPNPASGHMQLVAVEYAIPNTFPEPVGFTGNYDVWLNNTAFGLWLCHAWVWEYNPDGVFTGPNPNVP